MPFGVLSIAFRSGPPAMIADTLFVMPSAPIFDSIFSRVSFISLQYFASKVMSGPAERTLPSNSLVPPWREHERAALSMPS
eukprot:1780939-Pyramimonas_sp.AAC.1